jgi:transposase-like protein
MRVNYRKIRRYRRYSESFKKQLVRDHGAGNFSVFQLSKLHDLSTSTIYRWIYMYSSNEPNYQIVEMKESSTQKLKLMEGRIKDLERIVGQKQIKIDYLEKLIEIAEEELKIDIKKNIDTPHSSGSGKTRKE